MARIRTIKPEFWTSEQVVECSRDARLLFIGIWNFCDDAGIHPFNARQLKMKVFPGDDMSSESIRRCLDELSANDLIHVYQVDNQSFLKVTGWRHQKIDKPTYRYPPPPEGENSPPPRRALAEASPPEGSLREGKGSRGSPLTPLTGSASDPGKAEAEAKTEPPAKAYRFQGKVIRLTQADFDRWAETYHAIPDLAAELQSIDDWCDANLDGEQRRKWFHRVSAMLGRKHQEALAKGGGAAQEIDYSLYTRTGPPEGLEEQRAKVMGTFEAPAAETVPDAGPIPDFLDRRGRREGAGDG